MAGNEGKVHRISLGEEEFNELIGGNVVAAETSLGTTVEIVLLDIGWGRMQYLIELWLHDRQ